VTQNGKKIKKKKHRKWDEAVGKIAGGLTLLKAKKGRWLYQGVLHREKMIRVRIAADALEMLKIVALTKEFYEQKEVMYYIKTDMAFIE
jgi:hypothetical protein